MSNPKHSGFECPVIAETLPAKTKIKKNEDGTIQLIRPIEISLTKNMADKMKLPLIKTESTVPDINHWYAKVLIFNRKRYVLAINSLTRFAVIFKLNTKTFSEDFKLSLRYTLEKYELEMDGVLEADVILSLGNSRKTTAQLNNVGQEIDYVFRAKGFAAYEGDYADLFADYNKHNLGTAGDNKKMSFALDEMRKALSES